MCKHFKIYDASLSIFGWHPVRIFASDHQKHFRRFLNGRTTNYHLSLLELSTLQQEVFTQTVVCCQLLLRECNKQNCIFFQNITKKFFVKTFAYSTKQNPHGVFLALSKPIIIRLTSPARENNS